MTELNAADDEKRLETIERLGIIEGGDNPALDDIVRLAALLLDVPLSLVSIVGRDRQYFRANVGLPGVSSTPRDISFCTHAVQKRGILVVADATRDARFAANPLVQGSPEIRAYAGAPLIASDGSALGTLCAIDHRPREFPLAKLAQLERLARITTALLEAESNARQLQTLGVRLAMRERQLQYIADSIPVAIAHVDLQDNVLFANERLKALNPDRHKFEEPLRVQQLLGEDVHRIAAPAIMRARRGEIVRFELNEVNGGETTHHEVLLIPEWDESGDVVGHLGIRYDVTERARQAESIRQREMFLQSVQETMAEGLVVMDTKGQFIQANAAAEQLLGLSREELLGTTTKDSRWRVTDEDGVPIRAEDQPALQTLKEGVAIRQQILAVNIGGNPTRWLSVNTQPLRNDANSPPHGVVVTFGDITRIKELQLELAQAKEDLRAILDHIPAQISSWKTDASCRFANRTAAENFFLNSADIVGQRADKLAGKRRWERARPHFEAALTGTTQRAEFVDDLKDGKRRYRQLEWIPQKAGQEVIGIYTIVHDVTAIREFSERVRELAQRVETVREQERRTLALILHEGVAQDLVATRLLLDPIRKTLAGKDSTMLADCGELAKALDQCIDEVRRLATGLQPTGLEPLGIVDAIRRLTANFIDATGLTVELRDELGAVSLDGSLRGLIFRATEEALRNIEQHSNAKRVLIRLVREASAVRLQVEDDGDGIAREALDKAGSLGLLGIRERCRSAGGTLEVVAGAKRGTVLTLRLPMPAS